MFSPIRMDGGAGFINAMMPLAAGAPPAAPQPKTPPPAAKTSGSTVAATPPSKTTSSAASATPKTPSAAAGRWLVAPEVIETMAVEWSRNPTQMPLFRDLEKIAASSGTYRVKKEDRLTEMTPSEAVSFLFWQKAYAKLTAAQRATLMRELVRAIGPKVGPLHAELLITAAARDVREVADAIEQAVRQLPTAEIAAGKRDAGFLRNLDEALHARRQAELGGAKPNTGAEVSASTSPSDRRFAIAPAAGASYLGVYAPIGEKLSQGSAAIALSLDWMSGNRGPKSQPYFGVYGQLSGGDLFGIGGRAGVAYDWTKRLEQRFGLSAGYLRLRGEETTKDDTPVDVTGVTPNRSAYIARANGATDRTFQGALLMANLETDLRVYRADSSPFSLNGFFALSAGLVGGSLSDDGCSYTVPADDARVKPQGSQYLVSSPKAFGSRCRNGEFSLGGAAGLTIGVRGEL